jgi:hypothetical protein
VNPSHRASAQPRIASHQVHHRPALLGTGDDKKRVKKTQKCQGRDQRIKKRIQGSKDKAPTRKITITWKKGIAQGPNDRSVVKTIHVDSTVGTIRRYPKVRRLRKVQAPDGEEVDR